MSGSGIGRHPSRADGGLTPAEQHLGDRLAALIDGELGHDARERVLSHLASCHSCKVEADAQRRVKNVFADTAPPPPSDGLLARLQGLPAGCSDGRSGDGGGPAQSGGSGMGGEGGDGAPGDGPLHSSPLDFAYLPGGSGHSVLSAERGFRIHDMERAPWRGGRRFAFAAAGAVSLAAIALGSALASGAPGSGPSVTTGDTGGTATSSVRTASSGSGVQRERRRRLASNRVWSGDADATSVGARTGPPSTISVPSGTAPQGGGGDADLVRRGSHGQSAHGGSRDFSHGSSAHRAAERKRRSAPHPSLQDIDFATALVRSAQPTFGHGSYGAVAPHTRHSDSGGTGDVREDIRTTSGTPSARHR